jgi:hypothetical protein
MIDTIKFLDEVWTEDGHKLGEVHHIHHRPGEVDPDLLLYETYLEIQDFGLGMTYFVPTEFVQVDGTNGRVIVNESFREVLSNRWNNRPPFIAGGFARTEELPRRV